MKTNRNHHFCFLIFASVLATGCGRSSVEEKLVGSWALNANGATVAVYFGSDRTFTQTITGSKAITQSGHWDLKGSQLFLKCEHPRLFIETNRVAKVDDSELVLQPRLRGGGYGEDRAFTQRK